MNNKQTARKLLVLVALALLAPIAGWADDAEVDRIMKGGLGLGVAYVRFDTNARFTNKESGRRPIFIDAEGTLGLPETDTVPTIAGLYRFSSKHALGFSYFQVRREVTVFDFDETVGEITVQGTAKLTDKTRFYDLAYMYTFFEDDRSYVLGSIGLNGLDLRYGFEANGQLTIGGVSRVGEIKEEANVFAPLPLFGLDFLYSFTPKWLIATRVALVGGRYQDVTAGVLRTDVRARYRFNRRLGAVLGITYFDADVKIEDDQERIDVNYGYNGGFFGLYINF
ncbi:MAG: hypothetical protein JSW10_12005 [Pseudomonadota bacterium]|nr:MAG: hypothetical protein JSW10_12005 [Pseudomonadota bacterium]